MSERLDKYCTFIYTILIYVMLLIILIIVFPKQKDTLSGFAEHLIYFLFFGICYLIQDFIVSKRLYQKTTIIEKKDDLTEITNILVKYLGSDIESGD